MITFAKLPLQVDTLVIQHSLKSFTEKWTSHLNTKDYEGNWTVLPLRSPGGKDTIIPDLMTETAFADTRNMAFFPAVKELADSLQCPVLSVRFLNLHAGAIIKPHIDRDLSFEKGEARLHFPIFTNQQVEFYIEDKLIKMNEGECWYINANLRHQASNQGTTDRIHLVIDCQVNDWLKELFESSEKSEKVEVPDVDLQRQIIACLKFQETKEATAFALQLEQELENYLTSTLK